MKKLSILILILSITGCAGNNIISREFRPENTIHYSRLDTLEGAPSVLNSYAVYLDKGDRFPLELSFETDAIGIVVKNIDIVAKQKLFFMLMPEIISKEELAEFENFTREKIFDMSEADKRRIFANFMIYISKDAIKWAPVNDIKTIKRLFGNNGGAISFGIGLINKEGI
jgi:hypothetical protein